MSPGPEAGSCKGIVGSRDKGKWQEIGMHELNIGRVDE